jgi:dipeptidase
VFSDGEYAHKYYSGRRMWGAYKIFAPSNPISDTYGDLRYDAYPTFIKPDQLVDQRTFFKVHRCVYEGTKYDMTKGLAAGVWGSPDRWATSSAKVNGSWERSIGLYRTTSTRVVQARGWLPNANGGVLWFAPHSATGSVFTPFAVGVTQIAPAYEEANPNVFSKTSAYWAHRHVYTFAQAKYSYMMKTVKAMQHALEEKSVALVASMDALCASKAGCSAEALTAAYTKNAQAVVESWWTLPQTLTTLYADGWFNDSTAIGYPDAWLASFNDSSAYPNGPGPVPSQAQVAYVGLGGAEPREMPPRGAVATFAEQQVGAEQGGAAAQQQLCAGGSARACIEQACREDSATPFRQCALLCLSSCAY